MGWQEVAAIKQKQQLEAIPEPWKLPGSFKAALDLESGAKLVEDNLVSKAGFLSKHELAITETQTAKKLLDKLASRELSSTQVTTAFCKRAAMAQQLTNCLTEIFFDRALERAKHLDEYIAEHGAPIGPLHGLPISLKDSFCLKGIPTTLGWTSWVDHGPQTSNSALVEILLKLGAVLYCKTNIPHTMMTADSENNLFRRTLNPLNTAWTAGGSSGGEGSLVASRGSILGVGTDIAGSIRIPSLCCGVYGFKPSTDRVPFGGQLSGHMEGLPGLKPAAGPIAHSLDDIEVFMKSVLGASPENYDSNAHAVAWRNLPELKAENRLTIGVVSEDPNYPLHPPIRRAIDETVRILQIAGHNVVPLSPDACQVAHASRLAMQYFITGPNPAEGHFHGVNAEPPVKSVALEANPFWTGPPPVEARLDTFYKYDELHKVRKQLAEEWLKLWVSNNLDAVMGPGAQNGPVPHDTFGFPPYTLLYNVLDVSRKSPF